jgi:glutamate-1-semialdehyde 2,1-aminomutase
MMSFGNKKNGTGQRLYKRAKKIIPGGTQLLSKRPEMFAPEIWPAYYKKAKGCKIWDLDDNEYTDMSIMGIGANILGYADEDVDQAVKDSIDNSVSSSLNCYEEVDLAELLIKIHPWADMVRYTRSGGEACALAVRIARASTGRDKVFFSGYHGWYDWYLAANIANDKGLDGQLMPGLEPSGVPRALKGSAIPFHFNDINELKSKSIGIEDQIAAIIVEPARGEDAPKDYLKALKSFSEQIGAVLIFDEITTGFRMCVGGLHLKYGINPDIAVFAKSIANGYAMAVVIGTEKHMSASQKTFMSSTNWTERIGPSAAIATIKKYQKKKVHKHIIESGNKVKNIWNKLSLKHNLDLNVTGLPTLAAFAFRHKKNQELMTFFTIKMLEYGFLGFRQFKPSYAHSFVNLEGYTTAVDEVFYLIASGKYDFDSPVSHNGFTRLTSE